MILPLNDLIKKSEKVLNQNKKDKNKILSIHEPNVECVAKGKSHKPMIIRMWKELKKVNSANRFFIFLGVILEEIFPKKCSIKNLLSV